VWSNGGINKALKRKRKVCEKRGREREGKKNKDYITW